MKILHINSYYNGSKFYKNLYDKQIEEGQDIDVFVPVSYANKELNFDFGSYTTVSRNHNKFDRYIFHIKHYKIYKDIVKKYQINNYGTIHAHSLFSNGYIAMKIKESYGIPYIVAVRNTDVNLFFAKMPHLRKMGIKILKEANRIIFLSESYKDYVFTEYIPKNLRDDLLAKVSIIPNGIDNFWFKNIGNSKQLLSKEKLNLLFIGDINRNKNVTTTIKAIEILIKKGYRIEFTVVGEIRDQDIYKQIRNIQYVKYISPKSMKELRKIYLNNDIFVMPSIKETFGLVYAEAMSQGLPIVYSRGQGFDRQFTEGEVGYSVSNNSAEEISNRIQQLIGDYEVISKRCVNNVGKFNWQKISQEYIQLYYQIKDH
ncbi:glycosyltransferase family 4 protein [Psychrobacillus lasiicapitis]|uniref:Glycosyltransferase family 4 protein n=1 Tax=Psychrobacillus lasiicapitis TaxID=1636719 RepID=A0A544TBS2_9BACI|nr:glycosyltransferase family 4 protein [Psychrobacillus lasiicapitis]TQR14856.1 glycosyltransferase family 4 protein [Psychrobacillus lasiicapitis]GGA20484.1 glycoside hydrolase [Psychrobacillus lasiicapitis]